MTVQAYLSALANSLHESRVERLLAMSIGQWPSDPYVRLAWLHPRAWMEYAPEEIGLPDPRGKRTFSRDVAPEIHDCQWSTLAGEACTLQDEELRGDHVWPYSLGGPTVPQNFARLCQTHNALKSALVFERAMTNASSWSADLQTRLTMYASSAGIHSRR